MALPSKPAEHDKEAVPSDHPTPTPRTTPDEGHANAADKPFYERPGHAGAANPAVTSGTTPAATRKVKED